MAFVLKIYYMKNILGIIILELLFCNFVFTSVTVQSIVDKFTSSLTECEGGKLDMKKDKHEWSKWKNCFGSLTYIGEDGLTVLMQTEFDRFGNMHGKTITTDYSRGYKTLIYGKNKKGNPIGSWYLIFPDGRIGKMKTKNGEFPNDMEIIVKGK